MDISINTALTLITGRAFEKEPKYLDASEYMFSDVFIDEGYYRLVMDINFKERIAGRFLAKCYPELVGISDDIIFDSWDDVNQFVDHIAMNVGYTFTCPKISEEEINNILGEMVIESKKRIRKK